MVTYNTCISWTDTHNWNINIIFVSVLFNAALSCKDYAAL